MSQLSWIIAFIPDSIFVYVYYCLFILGAGFYIISKLVAWIPVIKNYKLPVELIGVISLIAATYLLGGYGVEMSWRQRVAELEAKIKESEEKSKQVNTVIQEKVVYKTKRIKEVQTVIVEKIKEVEKQIDSKCELDPAVIKIHNESAEDPTKDEVKK
jgi:hypothetical protein